MKTTPKKDRRPAFQFYPADWLSSTSVSLMSPAEEGAYIRLLCHAWMSDDCGLPDDDDVLAELSRLRSQWKKSGSKIRAKFEAVGGRLFNPRLAEERVKQDEFRAVCSVAGKASARSKAQRTFNRRSTPVEVPLTSGCDSVATKRQPEVNSSVFSLQSSKEEPTKTVGSSGGVRLAAPSGRWRTDEIFCQFVKDYNGIEEGRFIDEDFDEAYEYYWKNLDWEGKSERVKSLAAHIESYRRDPTFVVKPEKFLRQEWKRKAREPPKRGGQENTPYVPPDPERTMGTPEYQARMKREAEEAAKLRPLYELPIRPDNRT